MDVNYLFQHFSTSPSSWTQKEIGYWLELLNMKEYQSEFEINKVDGLIIFDLEDKEMEEILGVQNSIHRKRLRNGIKILKAFRDEFDLSKKKAGENEYIGGLDPNDNVPSFSTSVLNFQPAKVLSIKGNQLSQFNNQTAQRRELENIFNSNALAHFDAEISFPAPTNYISMGCNIEEEKASEDFLENDNIKHKNKKKKQMNIIRRSQRSFDHTINENEGFSPSKEDPSSNMNIEDEDPKNFSTNINGLKSLKRSMSALEEHVASPREIVASPLSCHQNCEPLFGMREIDPQHRQFEHLAHNLRPEIVQTQSAELIIQPVDGQPNNFYCINEKGGRIGRHSNNEIVILEESVSRHHSVIEYKENRFYLVDIGSTTGSFVKILTPLILQEGMIIELGSNQFYVEQITIHNPDNGELHLKVIEGMHIDKDFIIGNYATIGRKGQYSPTTITLTDDLHLSNTHTKISFSDSKYILEDQGSTNGSWLRLSPEGVQSIPFELSDGLIFKIGASSTFRVKRSNTNYLEMMQSPKNFDGTMNCAICYENDRDVVFIPCKHNVACIKCSKSIKQCPVCRFKITDIIKIYRS